MTGPSVVSLPYNLQVCITSPLVTVHANRGQTRDIRERGLISGDESHQELAVDLLQVPDLGLAENHTISATNGLHLLCADAARVITLHQVVVEGNRCSLAALLSGCRGNYCCSSSSKCCSRPLSKRLVLCCRVQSVSHSEH